MARTSAGAGKHDVDSAAYLKAALLSLIGLGVLVWAHLRVHDDRRATAVVACIVIGTALWGFALRCVPPHLDSPRSTGAEPAASPRVRRGALALAVCAAGATWLLSADGVYTRWNLLAWVAAGCLWLYAVVPSFARRKVAMPSRRTILLACGVAAVIAVGAFFRFHDLSGVPGEPTSDHAEKLLDVEDVLDGEHAVFFPRNTGREPLQFYISAGLARAGAEPSFEMLKAGTAFVGLLAVVGVLLLGRELAGWASGLVAGTLVAVSAWPVSLARDGLRHPFALTASAFALWLLFRYLRTRRRWDLVLCGVVLGVGLHGYTAFRVVPVFVLAVVAVALARRPRAMVVEVGILVGTVAVAVLPLARYTVDHPDLVWFRTLHRVGSAEAPIGGPADVVETFATNVWNAALAFTWHGESGSVVLVRFEPFLDAVSATALLAGLVVFAGWLWRRADVRLWVLVVALPVLSLPSVLNLSFPEENPSASRMGPLAPVVFVVAAFSLAYLVQLARTFPHRVGRGALSAAVAAALVVAVATNYVAFFRDFDRQYRAFIPNTSEAVAALRRTGLPRERLFILPFGHWLDPRNVGAALGSVTWGLANVVEPDAELPDGERGLAFVLSTSDVGGRKRLAAAYPRGTSSVIRSDVGKDFIVFVAPP